MSSHHHSTAGLRMGIVAVIATVLVAACTGDTDSEVPTAAPTADPATTATQAPSEPTPDSGDADEEPAANDAGPVDFPATGESSGRRITVEDFGPTTLAFAEVEAGMEAVYIEVLVENISAEPFDSNVFQFFLIDPTGEEYAPELLGSEAGDTIPQVNPLSPGESSSGFVAFQVPVGVPLALDYAVNLSVGETITIPVRE